MVGAVAPSSRYLARKMLSSIDFSHAKVIVEYGPGTGVFTEQIVKRMRSSTTLLVIETNVAFYEKLSEIYDKVPNVTVVNDSAENTKDLLSQYGLAAPDYVVSGLPFAALPAHVSDTILKNTVDLLGDKGMFVTFQYTLLKRKLLNSHFSSVKIRRELRNIPPAYVLECRNT